MSNTSEQKVRIDSLKEGDTFRMRGGKKDLVFHNTEANVDMLGRSWVYCFDKFGMAKKYRRFPFTIVLKQVQDNQQYQEQKSKTESK